MKSFFIQTFGCKSNQYESQAIREALTNAGLTPTNSITNADIYIINTCSVTGRAGASCRNAIRKNLRANPHTHLVITGCGVDLGDHYPDLPSHHPLLVPNAKKHAIPHLLTLPHPTPADVANTPDNRFALAISHFHGHTRAFIKIHDGCNNLCSYCAVPLARGTPESRPLDDIKNEALRLVQHGHTELVLTGINIGAYRHGPHALADVVHSLAQTPGLARLRLGSVEPPQVDRNLVDAMASSQTVCPHIHLPLQSADDAVLAAMGRRYTTSEFMDKVAMLKNKLPNPAITTDIIVGFPGETAKAAEAARQLAENAAFSRLHVFLFSPRPGTRAATLRQTVTNREIEERKTRLIKAGEKLSETYAASCLGMHERVIVENDNAGLSDRYVRVALDTPARKGQTVSVIITGNDGPGLTGKICADSTAAPLRGNGETLK